MFRMPLCSKNRGSRNVLFKNQDVGQIRSELLLKGELFEDLCFPADQFSLGDVMVDNVEWKRPKELCSNPQLFSTTNYHETSVKPGKMSSPWVVSAISMLGNMSELRHMVMPDSDDAVWSENPSQQYLGLFNFCFWQFGSWTSVVIDDRLPTVDGKLLYTQSEETAEFWVPLLEKAYAKLHGSYQNLDYGYVTDALVDFTGGVAETYDLNIDENDSDGKLNHLMETINHELSKFSIVCLKMNHPHLEEESDRNELGLTRGAVYQIVGSKYVSLGETGLQRIFGNRNRIGMVQLHGAPPEHVGSAGSQKSTGSLAYSAPTLSRLLSRNPKWTQVKRAEQHRMGLGFDRPDEFWMPVDDLIVFSEVIIVHYYTNNAYSLRLNWKEASVLGHWSKGVKGTSTDRCGGCLEFNESYLRNPQYLFDIPNHEENLVLQLLQWQGEDDEKLVTSERVLPFLIGFFILKVEENRIYRLSKQWDFNPTVVTVHPVRKRQLYYCGTLGKGRYIIVPHTYKPEELAGFMLRTFSKTNINLRELKEDGPTQHWPKFLFKYPSLTTVVVVASLNNVSSMKGMNLWVELKCEGKKGKTLKSQESNEASWNSAFVFYRAHPEKPISLRLYCQKWQFFHTLLGQAELPAVINRSLNPLEVTLRDKSGEPTATVLSIKVLTIDSILQS